jgi:hypothetical protein
MIPSTISRRPKWPSFLMVVALAAFALVAVRPVRESVLRAAGWALVVNETVVPADFIVLSLDSGGSGALEAADLLQNGVSKRVAVFTDPRVEKITSLSAGGSLMRIGPQGRYAN